MRLVAAAPRDGMQLVVDGHAHKKVMLMNGAEQVRKVATHLSRDVELVPEAHRGACVHKL